MTDGRSAAAASIIIPTLGAHRGESFLQLDLPLTQIHTPLMFWILRFIDDTAINRHDAPQILDLSPDME